MATYRRDTYHTQPVRAARSNRPLWLTLVAPGSSGLSIIAAKLTAGAASFSTIDRLPVALSREPSRDGPQFSYKKFGETLQRRPPPSRYVVAMTDRLTVEAAPRCPTCQARIASKIRDPGDPFI